MDSRNGYSNNSYSNNSNYGSYGAPQTPAYNDYGYGGETPMSVGDWIVTMLLTSIPFVNIIMIIVWAASATNRSKKNWAIATLIFMGIAVVLTIVLSLVVGLSVAGLAQSALRSYY